MWVGVLRRTWIVLWNNVNVHGGHVLIDHCRSATAGRLACEIAILWGDIAIPLKHLWLGITLRELSVRILLRGILRRDSMLHHRTGRHRLVALLLLIETWIRPTLWLVLTRYELWCISRLDTRLMDRELLLWHHISIRSHCHGTYRRVHLLTGRVSHNRWLRLQRRRLMRCSVS